MIQVDRFKRINHLTDRLLVNFYPRNAGGKFLLNCLGLSSKVVLQDRLLANLQFQGKLSANEKLAMFRKRLSETDTWQDLGLGCKCLFGDDGWRYGKYINANLGYYQMPPIIGQLSWFDTYFPVVCHAPAHLQNTLRHWPRAKILVMDKGEEFIKLYRPRQTHWDRVKGPDWPQLPPESIEEYLNLPVWLKQEIKEHDIENWLHSRILWQKDLDDIMQERQQMLHDVEASNWVYRWNVPSFFDKNLFMPAMADLYAALQLDDFPHDLISIYYDCYLDTLLRLQTKGNS